MEKRGWWWNGKWGRMARRDVLIYEDAGQWWIEAREGGAEGRSLWRDYPAEDAAMDCVHGLIAGSDRWRQMSD